MARSQKAGLNPINTASPDYFHQVANCQSSCPAHTPVPEYLRMIASGHYNDAYLLIWQINVFHSALGSVRGRTCVEYELETI